MNQHPQDPNIWGLRNLSDEKWVITLADGTIKDVEPGQNVTLAMGTEIAFGKVRGEIRLQGLLLNRFRGRWVSGR